MCSFAAFKPSEPTRLINEQLLALLIRRGKDSNLVRWREADAPDRLFVRLEHLDVVHVGLPVLDVAAVIT